MEIILLYKSAAIIIFLVLVMACENLLPKADSGLSFWVNVGRIAKNFTLFVLNAILSPLFVVPLTLYATTLWGWRGSVLGDINDHWGMIVFDVLLLDFIIYNWHKMNHEFPFLWRFHKVHHLDEFLDASSAVRFHFGEVILSACVRALFVLLCGIRFEAVIIAETLLLIASIFQHSNMRVPVRLEKLLTWVIVTPAWHWMHHHTLREDTDSNYGNMLTIWDRLFGSQSKHTRTLTMPIGLDNQKDKNILKLLVSPIDKN